MSIYIAQEGVEGGLHWSHTAKGIIFFVWALAQRITPFFFGAVADKKGYKATMLGSYIVIICGYWAMSSQTEFIPFLLGATLLGIGSGIFKPSSQGAIAHAGAGKEKPLTWSLYFTLFNLAAFAAIPVSKYLKSASWNFVFLGSCAVIFLNFILTMFLYDDSYIKKNRNSNTIALTFKSLIQPRIILFISIMSGFSIIYMQFYETLPNYIYDWVDTSEIIKNFNLPNSIKMTTPLGEMISYEWLYNINTGLIILFVSFITWTMRKIRSLNAILLGITLSTLGLFICGYFAFAYMFVFGIIVYTFGEMITNTRFVSFLDESASEEEKGAYLSFLNISYAIGLSGGSLLGGVLYDHFGDKATLALNFLKEKHNIIVDKCDAIEKAKTLLHCNDSELRNILWNQYSPYQMWYVFLTIGIISIIALYVYNRKYGKKIN
jgi:MFS family permease